MNDLDDLLQSAGGVPVPADFQEAIEEIQADLTPVADDLFAPDFDAAIRSIQRELDTPPDVIITSMVVHANMLYLALSDGRLIKSAQRRRNDPFEEVQYV